MNVVHILGIFLIFSIITKLSGQQYNEVNEFIPAHREYIDCCKASANRKLPSIYCYNGKEKKLKYLWETVSVDVKLDNHLFEQFEGDSPEAVMKKFQLHQSSWSANLFFSQKRKKINLDPFNKTCIGILTSKDYAVKLIINPVDNVQLLKFITGLFLFYYARKLCHNQIFYYLCGITLGICCSILILVYLISRVFPNRPLMYSFAAGGWGLAFYFLNYLMENAKLIVLDYKEYVLGYIAISGLISFAICYRFGPMENPRTRNLIQWSLQFGGLGLIFISSYLCEATYAIALIIFFVHVVPFSLFSKLFALFSVFGIMKRKLFKPKIKLLSRKEYIEQGNAETKKALEELRGYCSSPECNAWKTVLKLKNPSRFAQFIQGSPHLSDEEVDQYDSLSIKPNGTIITDDSDSIAEYSEDE